MSYCISDPPEESFLILNGGEVSFALLVAATFHVGLGRIILVARKFVFAGSTGVCVGPGVSM